MRKKQNLIALLLMLALCFEAGTSEAFPPKVNSVPVDPEDLVDLSIYIPPPGLRNVLLLVTDDAGIGKFKPYIPVTGNSPAGLPATPNIRRLRKSGIIFDNAWANPVCSPTRAGFLTGRHSFRTTVANAIPIGPDLPDAETTLPELISGAGYVSGLFGKWHLGAGVSGPYDGPLDQGFDHHQGAIEGALPAYDSWDKYENGLQVDGDPTTVAIDPVTQYATEANAQDALDWIQLQDSNWFAVVAFNAPHTPLHTPTAACDGVASAAPDINGMIECVDHHNMAPLFVAPFPLREYMYTDRCSNSMFQAAIRNEQYKLIHRLDYNVVPLNPIQELYDVTDLAEMNDLFGTGIAAEALLLNELNSMWASQGYNPLAGCP